MRPKGTRSWQNTTSADQQAILLSSYSGITEGCLYSINISWVGQTAGDRIVFHAGTSTSGTKIFTFVIPTAVGSFSAMLPSVGLAFETGIYVNPNISDVTQDKLKICLGWDVRN